MPNPRGGAVRVAAEAVGRVLHAGGYAPPQARSLLAGWLLPALDAVHPGPEGEWLWDRVLARVAAAQAGAAGSPAAHEPRPPIVSYRLDADDVVIRVNDAWRAAAAAGAAGALADAVVGTSLWTHVQGARTRRVYAAVHAGVRRTGRPFTLQFRCDAPDERRWMHLGVHALGRGRLEVHSTLVHRAPRPAPAPDGAPSDVVALRRCSLCLRVRTAAARGRGRPDWREVEDVPASHVRPAGVARPRYDLCRDCAADSRAALSRAAHARASA
ncbi:hypothetical protein [Roseisolibacter sp. H3M3-2]|uniref:hypothetical protein n=1 Tax=Roseisolibacter sp. H3M3-2 TaxID=3031323 RepID=UPI0023DB8733|nr:hypothetical protein [Roseisolibacter sp. H3M3-2]